MTNIVKVNYKSLNELSALSEIIKKAWQDCLSFFYDKEVMDYLFCFLRPELIKRDIKLNKEDVYFIQSEKENIGFIQFLKEDDTLYLSRLYLLNSYCFKGHGKNVFELIKKIAKDIQCEKIKIYVDLKLETSIKIFQKLGFKKTANASRYIGNDITIKSICMYYYLS